LENKNIVKDIKADKLEIIAACYNFSENGKLMIYAGSEFKIYLIDLELNIEE
jgi:hypothetical protein